ncbi:beta-ketoacyl synthase [Aspergillus multicolor]|uniref:beta-ketoacyl synthase n=1 Tax=Aspergillus multicolor TaxID=41759 RepID=UPI003CCCA304
MDPQQRLLLEVVYEALEDAGITLDEISGSQTSVYCGSFTNDYNAMTTKDLATYPKYTVTGTGNSVLANRISYFYDLHGPSATIDTACSFSLVCFHMGAQSLRNGEAEISIVMGSALHFDPNIFITMTDLGMLSTDGRCRHGDAQGSGYVPGEGIAALGITFPSAEAQAELIRSTYERAGLHPAETSYNCKDVLHVGSVKTNIGHLEGAQEWWACSRQRQRWRSGPNPEADFKGWGLKIPTVAMEWKRVADHIPRRASINSFGYGGTNAHVILEEYCPDIADSLSADSIPTKADVSTEKRPYLVPLTSHSDRAGKLWGEKLTGTMHRFRSFAIASNMDALVERIKEPLPLAQWKSKLDTVPRLGFVFTGQGAQWFTMRRSLIEQCPLFLKTLQRCDTILQALPEDRNRPSWSMVDELQKSEQDSYLPKTEYSQPIYTAVQLALVEVLAQSDSGELAATYAAGLLSFENALVAAYYRGVHMGSGAAAPGSVAGAMMAVEMTEAEVAAELEPYASRLAVAAMNGPISFTLQQKLSERKIFARRLQLAQA